MNDMTTDAARPAARRTPLWLLVMITGLLGLLYAYAVWNAVGNLIETVGFYGEAGLSLNALGWFIWIFAAILPILVWGAAFALAYSRLEALPAGSRLPLLLRYGFAVYKRSPDAAGRAFAEVLRHQADHPHALYGKAMVLAEQGRDREAATCFDMAVAAHPTFVDARRCRAVLLARLGELAAAQEEINQCLRLGPRAGISLYAAACVLARAAKSSAAPRSSMSTSR